MTIVQFALVLIAYAIGGLRAAIAVAVLLSVLEVAANTVHRYRMRTRRK